MFIPLPYPPQYSTFFLTNKMRSVELSLVRPNNKHRQKATLLYRKT